MFKKCSRILKNHISDSHHCINTPPSVLSHTLNTDAAVFHSSSSNHGDATTASRLINTPLPRVPYALPDATTNPEMHKRFYAECAGIIKPPDPQELKKFRDNIALPYLLGKGLGYSKKELWNLPNDEMFKVLVSRAPYHEVLHYAMLHGFFFLFDMLVNSGGSHIPLPHVMYTDFMKCKTFSTIQLPAEEQFVLSPELLRSLLLLTAYYLLQDSQYYYTAEKLFRTIEQQQSAGSEVFSAWVVCCTVAGQIDKALETLEMMEKRRIPFDVESTCTLMNPIINLSTEYNGSGTSKSSIQIAHTRLHNSMQAVEAVPGGSPGTFKIGVHAMFVAQSLLLRHAGKWELIRKVLSKGDHRTDSKGDHRTDSNHVLRIVSRRTLEFVAAVVEIEQLGRCGPKTCEALAVAFAQAHMIKELIFVLFFMRRNETLQEFAEFPKLEGFTQRAQSAIYTALEEAVEDDPIMTVPAIAARNILNLKTTQTMKMEMLHIVRRFEIKKDELKAKTPISDVIMTKKDNVGDSTSCFLPKSDVYQDDNLESLSLDRLQEYISYIRGANLAAVHASKANNTSSTPIPLSLNSVSSPSINRSQEGDIDNKLLTRLNNAWIWP